MEKNTPHYRLPVINALIEQGKVKSTKGALAGAAALGLDFQGMLGVVQGLAQKNFYKSMTSRANHKEWQDVYRADTKAGQVYLKLTVIDDVVIVSFKEL